LMQQHESEEDSDDKPAITRGAFRHILLFLAGGTPAMTSDSVRQNERGVKSTKQPPTGEAVLDHGRRGACSPSSIEQQQDTRCQRSDRHDDAQAFDIHAQQR
jgi:hypothetical protein